MNYRARGITKDGQPIFDETHEHIVVAHWLMMNKVFFIHVPNEGKRSWQTGKQLKQMGMRKGCPDFLIFDPPYKGKSWYAHTAVELKALDGRKPDEDQLAFLEMLRGYDWRADWFRGSTAAIRWLTELGYAKETP